MNVNFDFSKFKVANKKESPRKGEGLVKRICEHCGKEFETYS